MKKYQKSLFLFRRDLRVDDNTGLINASKLSSKVFPGIILDDKIISKSNQKFSNYRMQFFEDCVKDLGEQLKHNKSKLYIFSGNYEEILLKIIRRLGIDAIFLNKDYSPFGIKREEQIKAISENEKINFSLTQDLLLHDPEIIKTQKGEPYKVFSAFFRKAKELQYEIQKIINSKTWLVKK